MYLIFITGINTEFKYLSIGLNQILDFDKKVYDGRIINYNKITMLVCMCICVFMYVYSNVAVRALPCPKVNGERSPTEVYNDFRSSVLQILSSHKSPAPVAVANGTVPLDNPGTVPVDSQGTVPVGSQGAMPVDSHGTVPVDSQGAVHVDSQGMGQPVVDVERPSSHRAVDLVPEPRATDLVSKPETFPRTICVVGECYRYNNTNFVGLTWNNEWIAF